MLRNYLQIRRCDIMYDITKLNSQKLVYWIEVRGNLLLNNLIYYLYISKIKRN